MSVLKSYTISTQTVQGMVNTKILHTEIALSGQVVGFKGVHVHEDTVDIIGVSISNVTGLDAVVNNHEAEPLSAYKATKNDEIDARTRELIEQGFLYSGEWFSLSDNAQRNWTALNAARDALTYPFPVSTKTDGEHIIANAVDMQTFTLTALAAANTHYSSGRALKIQVNAAADKDAVNAIVDTR